MGAKRTEFSDLLVPANFIQAVRDSGYLSIATAVAELIDNSIQASAREIEISISRPTADSLPTVSVSDDGLGMSASELADCLKFGGSRRFNDRTSLGRFGVGLPAASLSQARRIRVSTWRDGQQALAVNLDVDALIAGAVLDLAPRRIPFPTDEHTPSGTRVDWELCDRIDYKRLSWFERALSRDLGRIFRTFLFDGLVVKINNLTIPAVDPLMKSVAINGSTSSLAFPPKTYELSVGNGGATSMVTVRFVELPVARWHNLDARSKKEHRIVGGAGVSILRAGREISFGWHLMGSKRKENYDDWWRCEIEFEPPLDEMFGISNNKQGIRPTRALKEALEPELESIARLLNSRVRKAFDLAKFEAASDRSCRIAERVDERLPVIGNIAARSSLRYRLTTSATTSPDMMRSTIDKGTLELSLNTDHPAFRALFEPLQGASSADLSGLRTSVELLLLSFARSRILVESGDQAQRRDLLAIWSDAYGRMVQEI